MNKTLLGGGMAAAAAIVVALWQAGVIGPGPEPVSVVGAGGDGTTSRGDAMPSSKAVPDPAVQAAESASQQEMDKAVALVPDEAPADRPEAAGQTVPADDTVAPSGAGPSEAEPKKAEREAVEAATSASADPTTAPDTAQPHPDDGAAPADADIAATIPDDDPGSAMPASAPDMAADTSDSASPPAIAGPRPPRFDLVRADPSGFTLVAGSAEPGAGIAVLVDGAVQPWSDVDGSGRFALFADLPPSPAPRILTLRMRLDGKEIDGKEEVILAPSTIPEPVATAAAEPPPSAIPQSDATGPAATGGGGGPSDPGQIVGASAANPETRPGTGKSVSAERDRSLSAAAEQSGTARAPSAVDETAGVQVSAEPAPDRPQQDAATPRKDAPPATEDDPGASPTRPEMAATAEPSDPTVLLSTEDGVRVLSSAPAQPSQVALDAITYDDQGNVSLSGRGTGNEQVRIYLNNRPITTSAIAEDGNWRTDLPQVDTGTYTLRVDQIDADGKVTSRAESPFLREDPEKLVAAAVDDTLKISVVTIQPGHTLWAIARDNYGEGPAYVKIYEANKGQIRDPDLIYPGQIFDIPD